MYERFAPVGSMAMDPRALGALFSIASTPDTRVVDGVALLTVRGPLASRRGGCFDSYDAILDRLDAALALTPSAVVLVLDSPGGQAQGCFEAAAAMRAKASAAGIPLLAYVDGSACSAAYAIACAASSIAVTPSSVVGSIGVYETLVDQTAADAAMGLAYRVVSTGDRKTDGNPHVAISDGAIAAAKDSAEYLGNLFLNLVEEMRGVPAAQVRSLDGALAFGRDAISKRLADIEVPNLAALLGTIPMASAPAPQVKNMDDIMKALQAVLDDPKSTDADKAAAKAALAALAPKEDAPAAEEKKDAPAPAPPSDNDGDETAAKALAEVHKLRAEISRREEEAERSTLLASRNDFAPELVASLKKAPMAMVREMVANLPRTVPALAAAASVGITRGEGQGEGKASRLPPEAKAALDEQMGLSAKTYGVVVEGNVQRFGAPKSA